MMGALKPNFTPIQMSTVTSMAQVQKKTAESVFVSVWKKITKGQQLIVEHGVGKEPRVVQLEFSVDGKNIGGTCSWTFLVTSCGCIVASKTAKNVIVQACKDQVGVTVNKTGVATPVTSGYVRVVAW